MKNNTGITIIALIITIILMLILATVSVNVAINGNIFEYAGKAKFVTEVGHIKNQITQKQILLKEKTQKAEIDEVLGTNSKYNDMLLVQNGEVVYVKENVKENQKIWLEELGINEYKPTIRDFVFDGKLKVGDYVNYTPDIGTYKVVDGEYGTGYTTELGYQSFETEVDNEETGTKALQWRILSINEKTGEIELVSATNGPILYLSGVNGYNHGVDILNDLCENLYSKTINGKKVALARSINADDINMKTTFDYTKYENTYKYGEVFENTRALKRYAALYSKEDGFYMKGVKQEGGLKESEGLKDGKVNADGVTEYKTITGFVIDGEVSVTHTGYGYRIDENLKDLGVNTAPRGLISRTWYDYFWVASRCGYRRNEKNFMYEIRFVGQNSLISVGLFANDNVQQTRGYGVLPVVYLNSNAFMSFDNENSTEAVTYWNVNF